MILVDTNVWSEATKRDRDTRVMDWLRRHDGQTILSTLVVGEIEQGIAMTSGPAKRLVLIRWKEELIADHRDRIVPFDLSAAIAWGRMAAPIRLARQTAVVIDVMLAAQARALNIPLATRNARDFAFEGVTIIDPWNA